MIDINRMAIILLKEWYCWTREATCKSNYPPVSYVWEKCGLAYQQRAGFDLSRGTKPIQTRKWEEAGHQFCKLDSMVQDLILGYLFHDKDLHELSKMFDLGGYRKTEAVLLSGLREYEGLCFEAGIIEEGGEMRPTYLVGWDAIGRHLGNVSAKTVQRWYRESNNKMPVRQVVENGTVISRRSDLDEWYKKQKCPQMSSDVP